MQILTCFDTFVDELLKRSIDLAAKEFPWIKEYSDRSVTEIEMRTVSACCEFYEVLNVQG
jgi:hypothetical protein